MRNRSEAASGTFIVFIIGIGFALIPASIISFIVSEREKNLRHMQLISGMNISSYWVSNMIFDILKAEIPMAFTIALIYIYSLDVSFLFVNFYCSIMMCGLSSWYILSA